MDQSDLFGDFVQFKEVNRSRIELLCEKFVKIDPVIADDFLDDYTADLKDFFCAKVANDCSDDENQIDTACDYSDQWITDNVSNSDKTSRIAAVLWLEGVEKGTNVIDIFCSNQCK